VLQIVTVLHCDSIGEYDHDTRTDVYHYFVAVLVYVVPAHIHRFKLTLWLQVWLLNSVFRVHYPENTILERRTKRKLDWKTRC